MPTYAQSFTYRDARGFTGSVKMYFTAATQVLAATSAAAVQAAITAMTNAAFDGAKGAHTTSPATHTYGSAAQFQDIEDKASLTFQTSSGQFHRFRIPAPLAAIFLADLKTVDNTNALVIALATAMVGNASSADGVGFAAYVGGIRTRVKLRRKLNIFILNPAET